MRDEDKPYICVRNGWMVQITPRNRQGWLGLCAWMLPFLLLTGGFASLAESQPDATLMIALVGLFLLVTVGWLILMIRWMMARSEVVDLKDIEAMKRDRKKGGKR